MVTLTVETPNGLRTGSAVQEVVWHESPSWLKIGDSGGWFSNELHGEAVVVEVAPNRYLFALLKNYDDPAANKVFRPPHLKNQPNRPDRRVEIRAENEAIEASRETRDIPRPAFPTLVTFEDLKDPSTAKEVAPDQLEQAFGRGYSLRSIQLTITAETKTSGRVHQVLGSTFAENWSIEIREQVRRSGPFKPLPFAFKIKPSDFIIGG
jgi:hypothetical protein